jgi:MFS family permease
VLVCIFGQTPADLGQLGLVCFFAGFFTNAGIVGLYAIFAHAFPTHVRATGTGFAIGVGRGGSVLAPAVAGFLFEAGWTVPGISILMALGSSVAAVVLIFLKLTPDVRDEQPAQQSASMPAGLSRAT